MTGTQRRQFEVLLRVRNFGNTYTEALASSPAAPALLGAIGTAIDQLTTTDMEKTVARRATRGDRKAEARDALIHLLQKATRLARLLWEEGHAIPSFTMPASRSDQSLLTAGRQLAVDVTRCATEFGGHGITAEHVKAVTAAFEAASRDIGAGRSGHLVARTRIQEILANALRHVRRLDVIVRTDMANDRVARALWTQARRLQDARRSSSVEAGPAEAGHHEALLFTPSAKEAA